MAKRVAVVTGSDSGIGEAIAVALAKDGFQVGVTWHSDEKGAKQTGKQVQKAGSKAIVKQLDLEAPADAVHVLEEFIEEFGHLDVLVNNAGVGDGAPFLKLTHEQWRKTMTINLDGPFLLAQCAAQHMVKRKKGGRIVNITSVHEFTPINNDAPYVASKHGLGGLTKQMAFELARYGILVNSVAPGMIATPMNDMEPEDALKSNEPHIPLGRAGLPSEIASIVAWLCGPGATYTTGKSFIVDGGLTLNQKV